MAENKKIWLFISLNVIIICLVVLGVMNLNYPLIGHDYGLGLPAMLDYSLHFHLNGFSIEWFSPSFGGGIPVYPDPNSMPFSPEAFFSYFLPPWTAMMVSVVTFIIVGFGACYYFLARTLQLHWSSAILGSFFFIASGYLVSRVAVGHLGYFTFVLFAIFLIIFFDPRLPLKIAVPWFALMLGMFFQSAGYFILIVFGLSFLMTAPLVFLYFPRNFQIKRIGAIVLLGGLLGLVLVFSRLTAVYALMKNFPRLVIPNEGGTNFPMAFLALGFQLLGVMGAQPAYLLMGRSMQDFVGMLAYLTNTGGQYLLWEFDASMTPIVFFLLISYFRLVIKRGPATIKNMTGLQKFAIVFFLGAVWIGIEFATAKGIIYPNIRQLPILSSLRANMRFSAEFIFPLAFLAAVAYDESVKSWNPRQILRYFLIVNILAVIPLFFYLTITHLDIFMQIYDVSNANQIYAEMQNGDSFEVTKVGYSSVQNVPVNIFTTNSLALLQRTSNLNLYDPVLGEQMENYHPQIHPGSVWDVSGGFYNLTNPMSFLSSNTAGLQPFERFGVRDKAAMEKFVNHLQPDWDLPFYQVAADWISGVSTWLAVIFIAYQAAITFAARNKQSRISAEQYS